MRDGDNARELDIDEALRRDAESDIEEIRRFDEDEADILQMHLDGAQDDDDVCEVIDRAYHAMQELDGV
jgi:hypothetical protein